VDKGRQYILLLSSRPNRWASARFREAAKARGTALRFGDPSQVMLETADASVRFYGRRIGRPHSVIPRLGPGNYENGIALLTHFETAGVPVANSGASIGLARDTWLTLLAFSKAGLRIPATARLVSIRDLKIARKTIPGPPWILKTFTGAMGIGTMLVREVDQLEALAATLWALHQPILMQEYLRSSQERISDIRALVIGERMIGAIRRAAPRGEFRSNVHRGGRPEAIELSRQEEKLALRAARAIGLGLAGIDWIDTAEGPVFLEANATPGFQGFEGATGLDVAGEMIDYAVRIGKSAS